MTKTRTGVSTSSSNKFPKRTTRAKVVDYNVNALVEAAFKPASPIDKKKKKGTTSAAAAAAKKKGGKKVVAKRGGPTYLALVKRILRDNVEEDNHHGLSILVLLNHMQRVNPAANRRYLRLALARGVASKVLVQTRQSFRLSAKEKNRAAKKKRRTASSKKVKSTKAKTDKKKKTAGTKRKATDKKKKTTKETSTKEKASKEKKASSSSSKKPAAKKARTSASTESAPEVRGTIAEGAGKPVWQYYDNGWHNYEESGSSVVEGVYQEYKVNTNIDVRAVQSGYFKYQVDFTNLHQTNIQTGTVRNIQRTLQQ